jgi:formylglycine-generating enzyme required for sulfatase activity
MMKHLLWILLFLPAFALMGQEKFDETRYALVIGNGAYTGTTMLANPVNDAVDMKAVLESLGFNVELLTNADLSQMEDAVIRLKNRLSAYPESYGFFYFAGHGVQSAGINYLIPADADIKEESFLRTKALSAQVVFDELKDAENFLNVLVLDACRDNPFGWARSGSRGLSVVSFQPPGSIIVYAAGAGRTASDGTGRNGLFTGCLLKNLVIPGLSVRDVLDRTCEDVRQASKNEQIPAIYSQFFRTAYLGSGPPLPPAPVPMPTPIPLPAPANMVPVEGGSFTMGGESLRTVTVKGFYIGKYEVTQKEWTELMGNNPSAFKGDALPVETVSWYDAVQFCNRLSRREGLSLVYWRKGNAIIQDLNATGYRLPTEAEWEYAAKGGSRGRQDNGSIDGWHSLNSGKKTHPVGTKTPNALGIYDMAGNVGEWCWDPSGADDTGTKNIPEGSPSLARIGRGGSWSSKPDDLVFARGKGDPAGCYANIGFRLVRPLEEGKK